MAYHLPCIFYANLQKGVLMNKGYRKVKERFKSVLSMLLIVSLVVLSMSIAEETQHIHAASEGLISSTVCPHKTGSPVTIAQLGCFSCGGSGVNWDIYSTRHGNRYSGNNISYGSGYQTLEDISPDGKTKTISYYRCYNCGDTGYDCKKYEELIRTEYYKWNGDDWVPDILQGEDGTVYPDDAASPGQTWVPRRWCSYCGPLIYESHGANACYTDATWAQYHLPNNSEITLDFTDMNGAAIADEEVRTVKKGDAFSYTAPGEIIHGGERYQLTGWTCEDAEGNQTSGTGEATIDKVSSDTYYIQFTYQKAAIEIKVELSAWLGEDKFSVEGNYSVKTENGNFDKVRVGWAKKAPGGEEATITFTEVAENSDSTSGDMFLGNAVEGCTYLIAVEVTTSQGTGVYYSNEVEIPVPEVAGTITLALSEDKTSITGEAEVSVEYAEYSQIKLNWYERKAGETAGSGASTTLTAEEGNRFRDTATKANVRQGYCYRAALIVTVRGKNYTFESNEILVPEPDATATPTPTPTNTPAPTPVPTATPKPTAAPTPIPHVCEFGDWVWDTSEHWKECECGAVDEKDKHAMTAGEPDDTGLTKYTCSVCGYTYSAHKHNYLQWCAEDIWDDTYDPDIYHWKICEYDSCGKVSGRAKHQPTTPEYIDNGFGWLEKRCKTCNWLMDRKAVTVNLTLHPNGGTFPDGSTDQITLENIAYNQKTDLWKLSSDYFPEKDGKNFSGYYVLGENVACMYEADYNDFTCTGTSAFFQKQADGTYLSKLTKDYVVYAQYRNASYTVEYHGNGADGVMYPSYHDVGVSKALSRNGYYFTSHIAYDMGGMAGSIDTTLSNTQAAARMTGWAATPAGNPLYEDGQIVLDLLRHGGTVDLYATWDYGSVILPNAHTADGGHKLAGWKTEDGTVISVLDDLGNYKQVAYPVHGEHTLTAVWVPNTYTVTFDTTGGTGCAPIEVTYLKKYSDNNTGLPVTTKDGYTFSYWKNAVTGETVTGDSIVTMAADHTLTAVWKANQLSILLDYNFNYEGTAVSPEKNSTLTAVDADTDTMNRYYGDYYGTLPNPAMEGYQFVGWYLEEEEAGRGCGHSDCLISSYTRVKINRPHTLYAGWIKDQYCVDLDANQDYTVWNPENQ